MPTLEPSLTPAAPAPASPRLAGRLLGEILVAQAHLDPAQLAEALRAQTEEGGRIGEILVARRALGEEDVARALATQLELPYLGRIVADQVNGELARLVPINFGKQARLLPLRREEEGVVMAVADPLDTPALDHARML
ncbi:MAG TPA: type II secretion system protein GspE, partial [Myxococcaceae bacterium]|nr:type II secretion system protein GspE [Myxococcaceae bacterium]